MKKRWLIICIFTIIVIISPTTFAIETTWNTNNYSDPLKYYLVKEIQDDKWTYETYFIIKLFFLGCFTLKQFYDRINNNIADAQGDVPVNPTIRTSVNINDIASVLNEPSNQLNCQQQCILFLAGVKATYSFVSFFPSLSFRPKYDFDILVVMSKHSEDIFPKHSQVVILKWKGIPRIKEIDTWDDYFGYFLPINTYSESRLYS